MTITDEQLSAYLDGELQSAELDQIAQALENDPQLAERFERLADSNRRFKDVLQPLADQDIPKAISALLDDPGGGEADTTLLPQAANDNSFLQRWSLPLAALIALFVGVGIGSYGKNDTQFSTEQLAGIVSSQNPLHNILENQPSGKILDLGDGGKAEVILSFANKNGSYCREFTVSSAEKISRAIACRNDQWNVMLSTQGANTADSSTYQTASSESDVLFDQFIEGQIEDNVLDAAGEQKLLQRGWKK